MKTQIKLLAFLSIVLLVGACSKKSDNTVSTSTGFSTQIQNIVSKTLLDSVKTMGMTINEGIVPPNIAGTYLESPTIVLATYTSDTRYKVGDKLTDYTYKFYEPSSDNSTLKVAYKSSSDNATGIGSFVSGHDNKFTIFSELKANDGNTYINIISGEISSSGIVNWQDTYFNKTKSNQIRIYKDGDGLASSTTQFRIGDTQTVENILSKTDN